MRKGERDDSIDWIEMASVADVSVAAASARQLNDCWSTVGGRLAPLLADARLAVGAPVALLLVEGLGDVFSAAIFSLSIHGCASKLVGRQPSVSPPD